MDRLGQLQGTIHAKPMWPPAGMSAAGQEDHRQLGTVPGRAPSQRPRGAGARLRRGGGHLHEWKERASRVPNIKVMMDAVLTVRPHDEYGAEEDFKRT